jgi:hypothetical protein
MKLVFGLPRTLVSTLVREALRVPLYVNSRAYYIADQAPDGAYVYVFTVAFPADGHERIDVYRRLLEHAVNRLGSDYAGDLVGDLSGKETPHY